MNEPKVPDSDTDWRTVDIFLFSNGQHHTPPRKYHLDAEDLSRWSATLMTLAQSQYGAIFSSIDLYTVEGQIVDNPMQISNGAAYVAVPPQDTFIPAGYNDYLLRASRSREKRQGKSKNNAQVELREGEFDSKIQATETEAEEEIENVEILNEELNHATTSAIGDQVHTAKPQYSARSNNTIKQLEKLNSNNHNSTILRKNSPSISPQMNRKTSMKFKENPLRKNLKVNTTKNANNGSTIITNSNNQFRTNSKLITKTGKSTERETTLKNLSDHPKIEKKIEQVSIIDNVMSSTEKTVTTDNTALENVIDDNELIVVKKQDSEHRSTLLSELERRSGNVYTPRHTRLSSVVPVLMPIEESKASAILKEEPPITVINNLIENVYDPNTVNTDIIDNITSKYKNKFQKEDNIQEPQEDTIKLSKKTPVDSFIAVIDKGDIVNLNLKIEVRKCEGVINAQETKHIIEKGSQVNIGPEIVETLAKRSNLTNKSTVNEDNPKVVVIQCSCCQNHNLSDLLHKIEAGPVKLDDKKYVMLLPDPQSDKNLERNQCPREESIEKEKALFIARSSLVNPVKKVVATTSVQRLTTLKSAQDTGITILKADSRDASAQDKSEVVEIKRNISSIQKIYQADSVISTKQKNCAQLTFVDKSTQTEWYTMLLEARRHEDGRYSFYLPPLHVLKYYNH